VSRSLFKSLALLFGLLFVAAGVGAATSPKQAASRAPHPLLAIYDDAEVFGHPARAFSALKRLHVPVLRATLRWGGGPLATAPVRPTNPADPGDPAYNWGPFDEMVRRANDAGIKVLATIVGTPRWANGGKAPSYPPKDVTDLRKFAAAAATRYSGSYVPWGGKDPLPAIRLWLAWNEPNNPLFIKPQFKKVGKKWVVWSAVQYAKICNAIYAGVHGTKLKGEKVACGATAPRGNNTARGKRPSVSPLVFLRALKKRGAKFDVYAHHPYYNRPTETPSTPPGKTAVTLGNIGSLLSLLKRLYGPKHLWITEYGYQTRPPDKAFGVSWSNQAKYLNQAYRIVRRYPRIDIFTWFLLRDERKLGRWQSGLMTTGGKKKPAYTTFARLER
jgi:hypothetical protein